MSEKNQTAQEHSRNRNEHNIVEKSQKQILFNQA
jgi:hypothetical protein